jgi:hypothetical protein
MFTDGCDTYWWLAREVQLVEIVEGRLSCFALQERLPERKQSSTNEQIAMQLLKRWALSLATVVAVSLMAIPAHATYETATFSNVNPGEVVTISNTTNSGTTTESGWAGVYNFVNGTGPLTGSYSGFCIDIGQGINSGDSPQWTVASLASAPVPGNSMGQGRANLIAELWYNNYADIGSSNTKAAAFQIAIWEIINETATNPDGSLNLDVTSGSFSVSKAYSNYPTTADTQTLSQANTWLGALDLSGNGNKATNLIALESTQYQDYVVQMPVPAPPGLMLGLVGAVSLLLPSAWRWRKRDALAATVPQ